MSIQVEHLTKTYRIARKAAGLGASLRSLFFRQYEEVLAEFKRSGAEVFQILQDFGILEPQ